MRKALERLDDAEESLKKTRKRFGRGPIPEMYRLWDGFRYGILGHAKTTWGKDEGRRVVYVQWLLIALYFPLAIFVSHWLALSLTLLVVAYPLHRHGGLLIYQRFMQSQRPIRLLALYSDAFAQLVLVTLVFASVYALFGDVRRGSVPVHELADYIYFSAVTVTTLGYGNLVPSGTLTEMIASLEAIVGFVWFGITVGVSASAVFHRLTDGKQR